MIIIKTTKPKANKGEQQSKARIDEWHQCLWETDGKITRKNPKIGQTNSDEVFGLGGHEGARY
jgi:hypothetical protein